MVRVLERSGGCSQVEHAVSSHQVNKPNERNSLVYGRDYRKKDECNPVLGYLRKLLCGKEIMVRKGGFEPPQGCPRQPLKLVRLPFRHFRIE
jgi:hypothetical protein